MATPKPTGIEKPGGTKPSADEPVINVIPDKFYQAGLKKRVKPEPAKPAAIPAPKPVASAGSAPPVPPKPAKKGFPVLALVAVAVLLLLGGGGAAYYFLVYKKAPAKPSANVAVNTNQEQPPQAACGDGRCDASETADSCAADCGVTPPVEVPPQPVCGDGQCDSGETPDSCSVDCKPTAPPQPTCGDGKCEGEETLLSCSADCKSIPGTDSDYDGVSDVEEREVYGTDPNDTDSDKDNFVDLNEVINLYNPADATVRALLSDNPLIAVYENPSPTYSILYPKAWTAKVSDATTGGAIFTAPSGVFIQVMTVDKPADQPLMDWYLAMQPNVKSSDVQVLKTKQGFDEVLSPDRMTAYVAVGDKAYVFSYDLGEQNSLNYRTTFQMMINSLKVK